MTLSVLRAGLDTVEVSLCGTLSDEVIEKLDRAKDHAVGVDGPIPFVSGIAELMMQPKAFGHWSWRLAEPRFHIVAKRKAPRGAAIAQVRFSAFGLGNEHPSMLWLYIRNALQGLGDLKPLAISRADVCVDFQGWTPKPSEMENIVTSVSYRGTHGTSKQVETYQYGKKTLLRVYDKTAELAVSKKSWLPELWAQNPAFDPDLPVWRVEFQAASDVIRQLGILSPEQLFNDPGALLDYGLRWAQLRVPTADSTKTRWPEDPRWTELRQAVFSGVPLQRRVNPSQLMDLDATARRLIGLAARAGAYFGTSDYLCAIQQLSLVAEVHMMQEGIDFDALVEDKRRRALSGEL